MVGLKLERFIDISWFQILWPVWILLGMVLLFILFFKVLIFLYIYSYCYEAATSSDIFSSLWIFYNLAGALFVVPKLILDLEEGDTEIMCIYPLIYLSISFISINPVRNCLIEWSREFLDSSDADGMQEETDNEEYLLPLSLAFANNKQKRTLKVPPRFLIRMSSTFFFIGAGQERKKSGETTRTRSYCLGQRDEVSTHYQALNQSFESEGIRSRVLVESSAESSFIEDFCTICCEKRSNSVFMECGHGGTCFDCAKNIVNSSRRCLMCRLNISQVLKIKAKSEKESTVVGAFNLD